MMKDSNAQRVIGEMLRTMKDTNDAVRSKLTYERRLGDLDKELRQLDTQHPQE